MPELITKATPEQTPDSSILKETTAFFNRAEIPPPVRLTQYDNLPYIAVHLVEGDEDYTVPDGAAVNIRMKKPDGTWVYNPAYGVSTDRHTAYIECTTQMTAVPGQCAPIIEVVVDGQQAGTAYLHFDVDRNPVQEDDVQSTDEGKTVQQLAQEAKDAADAAAASEDAAAKSATAAANSASAAKTSQTAAASSASAAASSASAAKTSASNAASSASAANTAKTEAQTAATNAEDSADAAADSAQQAAIEAQKALGFRSFYGGQILPEAETGDLDPSRPMSTPTAASVTIKARGDRIAGLTMAGKTTQPGTGDPSPENIRMISGVGMYNQCVMFDGSEDERYHFVNDDSTKPYYTVDFPMSYPNADWYTAHPLSNWAKYYSINTPYDVMQNFSFQPNTPNVGNRRIFIKMSAKYSTISELRTYLAENPLILWYRSVDYAKSKGPFYTVVELSDDPYRAVGFELTQPLFDGDSLKVGGKSGFDKMVVLDGKDRDGITYVSAQSSASNSILINLRGDFPHAVKTYPNISTDYGNSKYRQVSAGWGEFGNYQKAIQFYDESFPQIGIRDVEIPNLSEFRAALAADPVFFFYRSVNYTPENDIPVALEKRANGYAVFDGTENQYVYWNNRKDEQISGGFATYQIPAGAPGSKAGGSISSHFKYANTVSGGVGPSNAQFTPGNENLYYSMDLDISGASASDDDSVLAQKAKTYFSAQYSAGTPVQVVYELATPVSYARPVPAMIAQPGEDGTFTVTGENSLSVLLKAFQDGGDAATLGGQTLAQINAYNASTYLTKEQLLTLIYPVGSIYMSANATDPGTLFGGTWARIQGRFLLAADGSHAAGSTGGEETHTLTADEMPEHRHSLYIALPDMAETAPEAIKGDAYIWNGDGQSVSQAVAISEVKGGSQPHNNMPPYLAVYCWQRTA